MTQGIIVTRAGVDALGTPSPNQTILNSEENTFKILTSGTIGGSITGTTTITQAHGQGTAPAFFAFAKFPDGYVALPNSKPRDAAHPVQRYWQPECDNTNLYFTFYKGTSANYGATVSYYVFDSPVIGSSFGTMSSGQVLRVSKVGKNAATAPYPDDYTYASDFNTLKYYKSGSKLGTISATGGEVSVAHNLGYVPFFVGYVNKLSPVNTWSMCPQTFNDFGVHLYMNTYANTANLYFRWETDSAANTVTFYYQIFRNNLGL